MNCAENLELLLEAAEGEIPEAERAVLDDHLADCPQCRYELEQLRRTAGSLREAVKTIAHPPTNYLTPRRRARLLKAYRRKRGPVHLLTFRRVVAAAAVAVIIACTPFILGDLQTLLAPEPQPSPVARTTPTVDYAVLTTTGAEGPVRPVRLLAPRVELAEPDRPTGRGELVRTSGDGLTVPTQHALYDPEESSRWW